MYVTHHLIGQCQCHSQLYVTHHLIGQCHSHLSVTHSIIGHYQFHYQLSVTHHLIGQSTDLPSCQWGLAVCWWQCLSQKPRPPQLGGSLSVELPAVFAQPGIQRQLWIKTAFIVYIRVGINNSWSSNQVFRVLKIKYKYSSHLCTEYASTLRSNSRGMTTQINGYNNYMTPFVWYNNVPSFILCTAMWLVAPSDDWCGRWIKTPVRNDARVKRIKDVCDARLMRCNRMMYAM